MFIALNYIRIHQSSLNYTFLHYLLPRINIRAKEETKIETKLFLLLKKQINIKYVHVTLHCGMYAIIAHSHHKYGIKGEKCITIKT